MSFEPNNHCWGLSGRPSNKRPTVTIPAQQLCQRADTGSFASTAPCLVVEKHAQFVPAEVLVAWSPQANIWRGGPRPCTFPAGAAVLRHGAVGFLPWKSRSDCDCDNDCDYSDNDDDHHYHEDCDCGNDCDYSDNDDDHHYHDGCDGAAHGDRDRKRRLLWR